ncbi:uncharacterized protein LOC131005783 isoform X2 [Salvia miltiorrhiza]|uniref:uncharacterized protein LOC131005783 isoform X2 n=1 Tax=Salvia miltiorrhiza TaxID=226208 RepID=UPI0025AD9808|nr:uncharacterized protein LOC131005783 isoform X2 [Salvia miltiorrhiza]
MASRRGTGEEEIGVKGGGEYEESRAQRIKENMARMKSLGIAALSNQLLKSRRKNKRRVPSDDPPRRSSRLNPTEEHKLGENPEIYTEKHKLGENPEIDENPEIYTEEHEKLLGDAVAEWTRQVKYDPSQGKPCHQCKPIGLVTTCSKCYTASGQLCGVCLYRRYGENLAEVSLKRDWVCPVCRGICNCSHCRRYKGWNPVEIDFKKAQKLGFKSVAHYLIHTRRGGAIDDAKTPSGDENDGPSDDSGDEHDEDYEKRYGWNSSPPIC